MCENWMFYLLQKVVLKLYQALSVVTKIDGILLCKSLVNPLDIPDCSILLAPIWEKQAIK